MSQQGEPGYPGLPGEPGTGRSGGSGGTGGGGGTGGTGTTGGTGGPGGTGGTGGPGANLGTTTRALIYLLVFSIVLAGANFLFTASAIHRSQANTVNVAALCLSGNEARHQQIQLWTFLISISRPPPHETAAEKTQREKVTRLFLVHIHRVFAPRNCQQK